MIEKDFWNCVVEGPGKNFLKKVIESQSLNSKGIITLSAGMRILRCGDGVNCMVCDSEQIVVGLLNKTIEVYDRSSLIKVLQ